MSRPRQNSRKKRQPGGILIALVSFVLIVLVVAGYLFFKTVMNPALMSSSMPPSLVHKQPLPPKLQDHVQSGISSAAQTTDDYNNKFPAVHEPVTANVATVAGKGHLAIIIDDMGSSMQEARSLAGIGVPLTFSIIPGLRNYREVASYAADGGIEIMIHIPMQSKEWPNRRLEENGLLVSMGDADIRERMEGFLRVLPRAAGANNHTGSEFTEHSGKMGIVLSVLKEKGLFFIDSVTTPKTVGPLLAREMGMKSGRRNVFLDNEQNTPYIMGQLNQAVRLARKNGAAIAICHPHPATIKTLIAALPALEQQGITLVPASRLVR